MEEKKKQEINDKLYNTIDYIIFAKTNSGQKISPVIRRMLSTINVKVGFDSNLSYTNCTTDIVISHKMVELLTIKELAFVVCHEVCHVLFKHHLLRNYIFNKAGIVNDKLLNCAMDFYINSMLVGLFSNLISYKNNHYKWLLLKKYNFLNVSELDIYNDLIKNSTKVYVNGESLEISGDDINDSFTPGESHNEWSVKPDMIADTRISNALSKLSAGAGSGDFLYEKVIPIYNSKVNNWEKELRFKLLKQCSKKEYFYDYRRNKRNNITKFILPDYRVKKIQKRKSILFAVDCSGSVSLQQLSLFKGEILRVLKTDVPADIILFHTSVFETLENVTIEEVEKLKIKETGGTNFSSVFKFASTKDYQYICILTDGEGEPDKKYRVFSKKTLWLINNYNNMVKHLAYFGQLIYIK